MRKGASNRRPRATKAADVELDALIEKATVDAYDESEQMMGLHTMLAENLEMPFKTEVLGVEVTVEKLDWTDDDQICRDLHAGQVEPADSDPRPATSETATRGLGMDRRLSPMGTWEIAS